MAGLSSSEGKPREVLLRIDLFDQAPKKKPRTFVRGFEVVFLGA
jgi:hypothetical protein